MHSANIYLTNRTIHQFSVYPRARAHDRTTLTPNHTHTHTQRTQIQSIKARKKIVYVVDLLLATLPVTLWDHSTRPPPFTYNVFSVVFVFACRPSLHCRRRRRRPVRCHSEPRRVCFLLSALLRLSLSRCSSGIFRC